MKKVFLLLAGALCMLPIAAQTIPQGEPSLVYFSPKNEVVLDFTIAVEKREVGPYAAFAEELMGVKDVVKENETTHRIERVEICPRTEVDLSRPHVVKAEKGVPMQLLRINEKGLLTGYNCPQSAPVKPRQERKCCAHKVGPKPAAIPSIPEEVLRAGNTKAQAKALAKHIFQLRETRMYLLSGEVEHAPSDGVAIKHVLDALDKQEHELMGLFIGRTERSETHKEVAFYPVNDSRVTYIDTLFFSLENGFTNAENIDAEHIIVRAAYQKPEHTAPVVKKKNKKKNTVEPSQIVYNLPGYAYVEVRFRGKELGKRTMPIAQLGIDVPLAKELFTGNQLPVIIFNEQTGNIESIRQ